MSANEARIDTEIPNIPPNAVLSDTSRRLPPSASSKRSVASPSRMRLPVRRKASLIWTPSTMVPLRLPRSTIRMPFAPTRISEWKPETVASANRRSLPGSEPIAQVSPDDSQGALAPCPVATR